MGMTDREKVLKGLECCINSWMDSCDHECPYYKNECYSAEMALMHPVMRDALKLLKEQTEIVRCKDCRYGVNMTNILGEDRVKCDLSDSFVYDDITLPPDWFCADWEARSDADE